MSVVDECPGAAGLITLLAECDVTHLDLIGFALQFVIGFDPTDPVDRGEEDFPGIRNRAVNAAGREAEGVRRFRLELGPIILLLPKSLLLLYRNRFEPPENR